MRGVLAVVLVVAAAAGAAAGQQARCAATEPLLPACPARTCCQPQTPARRAHDEAAWGLPDLPRLVAAAAADQQAGSACGRHSRRFLRALRNATLWAALMYDASVKAPWGVLSGCGHQLGHFDQCLAVQWRGLRGQYCLPSVALAPLRPQPLPVDPYSTHFRQDESAWLKIQFAGDEAKRRRDVVWWALCVPASCSAQQVEAALNAALRTIGPRLGLRLEAELAPQFCSSQQPPGLPAPALLYLSCAAALIILVAVTSLYDVIASKRGDADKTEERQGLLHTIMQLFSARNNLRKLLHVEKRKSLQGYPILYVFLIFCVVVVHRYVDCYRYPIYNGEFTDMALHTPYIYILSYGTVYVNSFFARSGFHLAYCLSEEFEKSVAVMKIFLSIINRYLRLTPLYFVVILFYIYVLPYLGSGPLWKTTVDQESKNCEEYWWANILYINNYVGAKNMCIMPTWYLSVDFQLHILGAILIYMKWRLPKMGWTVTGMVLILSIVMSFSFLYQKQTDMFFKYTKESQADIRTYQVFHEVYISTFGRVSAYFIGIVGGLIVYNQRAAPFKISKSWSNVLFGAILTFLVATAFAGHVFCPLGTNWQSLKAVTLYILQQIAFALMICAISVHVTYGHTGIVDRLLTAKSIFALSQLGYATYLIHGIPKLYEVGISRYPLHLNIYQSVWALVADYCIIHFAALLLYLTVEAPMRSATRLLFLSFRYKRVIPPELSRWWCPEFQPGPYGNHKITCNRQQRHVSTVASEEEQRRSS